MVKPIPIKWIVKYENLVKAIQWSCKKIGYSIDRPNMNVRGLTESLDDKIMGDVATIALQEFLQAKFITSITYDQIRKDDFRENDPGWDIIIGNILEGNLSVLEDPAKPIGFKTISVKSSRLPKYDTIEKAIDSRDFKIFAYPDKEIEQCITSDIESQVYYDYNKSQLKDRTITVEHVKGCKLNLSEASEIVDILDIESRFGKCYLTAWNTKENIVRDSKNSTSRKWSSFGKPMWIAPLKNGESIDDLVKNHQKTGV